MEVEKLLRIFAPGENIPRATVKAMPGEKLSPAIWLSGKVAPAALCNGLGLCGNCRARFQHAAPVPVEKELEFFNSGQIAAGWRLTCQHAMPDHDVGVELPQRAFEDVHKNIGAILKKIGAPLPVFLGIDLGTTSIQWRAVSASGETAARGGAPNPQAGAGADVISRIAYAMSDAGRAILAKLALDFIRGVLDNLASANMPAKRGCVAANSAMTCILLRKDISGLAAAPWHLDWTGNGIARLEDADFVIPPLFSPFIGGDLAAGLLYLLEQDFPRPFILADLGTNAEMALLCDDGRLFLASAPLGPALEGIGPACGQPAGDGVITDFTLTPHGLAISPADNGKTEYRGIGATGYLSLIANLLRGGIMDKSGHFIANPATPMAAKLAAGIHIIKGQPAFSLPGGLFMASADVELILKVKAAFSTILRHLLAAAGIGPGSVAAFGIAGALGQNVKAADMETLGLIPPALGRVIMPVGNASLEGACILALQPQKAQVIADMRANARIIQATDSPLFQEEYLSAMEWGWDV